jgi:hypothetical protein
MKTDISTSVATRPGPSAGHEALERDLARKATAMYFKDADPAEAHEVLKMLGLVDDHLRPI